ncbi:hypothetical protein AVEN_248690-1 [Araneus ventricosus]|uniref:Uncharacterized protein n=1 Tax=Araneus ventricosus TaxID=182803 RepID=A0A4Y2C1W6_ARAVE|nr:hypothetical protein AVEN_248690-1 [Araneus ventricosus]
MMRTTPELATPSPNFRVTPAAGRLIHVGFNVQPASQIRRTWKCVGRAGGSERKKYNGLRSSSTTGALFDLLVKATGFALPGFISSQRVVRLLKNVD